jgi:predicted O-methyltransferase YrrM
MYDVDEQEGPPRWAELRRATAALGFDMPSDARTGALLKALVASKPGGRILELGTGTGLATAWLLEGLDAAGSLITVDHDPAVQAVASGVLGDDPRVAFVLSDGVDFLHAQASRSFDLVFADAWPGKYERRDLALGLVKRGGFYVGDDMLPQANWPEGHQPRVDGLIAELRGSADWAVVALAWGSGFVVATRR